MASSTRDLIKTPIARVCGSRLVPQSRSILSVDDGLLQLGQSYAVSHRRFNRTCKNGLRRHFTQAGGWLGPPRKIQTRTLENHKGAAPGTKRRGSERCLIIQATIANPGTPIWPRRMIRSPTKEIPVCVVKSTQTHIRPQIADASD